MNPGPAAHEAGRSQGRRRSAGKAFGYALHAIGLTVALVSVHLFAGGIAIAMFHMSAEAEMNQALTMLAIAVALVLLGAILSLVANEQFSCFRRLPGAVAEVHNTVRRGVPVQLVPWNLPG